MPVFLIPLPNTITADQNEVVVLAEFDSLDIGVASDGLAVVLELRIFLVVEVAEAARQVEMVINASSFNFGPRGNDPLQLQRVFRLMVFGKLYDLALAAEGSPRIAGVGDVEGLAD